MSGSIRVVCPACNAHIKAPAQLLGQVRPCPRCGRRLVIRTKTPKDAEPVLSSDEQAAASRQ
jgi:hypothetical protein